MTKLIEGLKAQYPTNVNLLSWDQALIIARQAAAIALNEFKAAQDPHQDLPEILKTREVAEVLKITPAYVSILAKSGKLQNVSKDKHLRFRKVDVLRYYKTLSRNCPAKFRNTLKTS